MLDDPYTDIDEQSEVTDILSDRRVKVRYVHGGFRGTDAKFALYFPAPGDYQGRFFQHTYPTIRQEEAYAPAVVSAVLGGSYLVSTNNGGADHSKDNMGGFKLNAAAAAYSRTVAAKVYETDERPRGYIYGASGGAYQTLSAIESTSDVWDGGVAIVPGVPNSTPSNQSIQQLAMRVLRDKFPQIVDALEPGGSGDPYAGLNGEEAGVLREMTSQGFPLGALWQYDIISERGAFYDVAPGVRRMDPTYVDDFWTKPGYAGTEPASPSVATARIQHDTTVASWSGSPANKLVLADLPDGDLVGADLAITSGAAAGTAGVIGSVTGSAIRFRPEAIVGAFNGLKPGDSVRIDSSWFLALQYYHRHQVPSRDMYGWDQFRNPDGNPLTPQRPVLMGPTMMRGAGGSVTNGAFNGKLIMLSSLLDMEAFPWFADWYHLQARSVYGPDLENRYRLWYTENADHVPARTTEAAAHVISTRPLAEQALLDLDAWIKDGIAPAPTTVYSVDAMHQVRVPTSAAERRGIQPVVTLTVNAADQTRAAVDESVTFAAEAEVPPGAGKLIAAEWDFAGTGEFPTKADLGTPAQSASLRATHAYDKPGTYFGVVRVTSQRSGDPDALLGRIQNLARVRVVVR